MFGLRQPLAIPFLVYIATACSGSSAVRGDLGLVTIEPAAFRASTGTIALASTRVMVRDIYDLHDVIAEFDSLVEARFRAGGFSVLRAARFDETVERITEEIGGVYDPKTGERDGAKVQMVYRRALEELRKEIDPDALIIPTIEVVQIEIDNTTSAEWLGTSECVDPPRIQLFGNCGSARYSGRLPALAFFVTIFDMDAAVVFRNGGGLQILEGPGGRVPRILLFADKERNAASVRLALNPLAGANEAR